MLVKNMETCSVSAVCQEHYDGPLLQRLTMLIVCSAYNSKCNNRYDWLSRNGQPRCSLLNSDQVCSDYTIPSVELPVTEPAEEAMIWATWDEVGDLMYLVHPSCRS